MSGDVLRYESERRDRWCREGMAIVDERGAWDTYWQSGSEAHRLTEAELASAVVVFNLSDYDELDRYLTATPATWATYHPSDRRRITSQHGLQARWFVRKGARPDLDTQIENAERAVADALSEVESAELTLRWRRQVLAALEASA